MRIQRIYLVRLLCCTFDWFLQTLVSRKSVVLQEYSWGRFRITLEAFQVLMSSLTISPRFLEIVTAFGVKTIDDERQTYGFRACSLSAGCPQQQHGKYP